MGSDVDINLWVALWAGMASFISPCVLPLVPSYMTYITGLSFGQLKDDHPTFKVRMTVFFHCLAFIAGFSTIFILLGALTGVLSQTFQAGFREWAPKIGGVLIFLFGLHLSGIFHFGILLGEKRVQIHSKPSGFFGTFLVGLVFAAGWTPCTGPILGSIMMLAGNTGEMGTAILMLGAYSVGLGIPFLLAGVMFHSFLNFFNRFRKHIRIMEIVTGLLLMLVGVLLFFDLFATISMYLSIWFPFLE